MKQWKLALSSADAAPQTAPILLKGTIEDNLRTAAALGYQAIEVHTREDVVLAYDSIRQVMKEENVRIAQIITGRLNTEGHCSLMSDEPFVVEAAMKGMYAYIDMASNLAADIVLGWVKGNVPAGRDRAVYMNRLAKNLSILNEYAKPRNVRINIEVINHYEVNVFTTGAELAGFLEEHQLDNCYVHLDTFHMNIEEDDMLETIRKAGKRIGYFHLADNQRWYPGSGQLDFAAILQTLEQAEYDGYLSVECFPRGDGEETARKALQHLQQLM
ncbi:MAG: TIM barrel protein [Lachnospiraceae bacterium]